MKVYALPEHIKYEPDYSGYNWDAECKLRADIEAKLKAWLIENGADGPYTGEVVRFGVADGYANYMFADYGRRSALIHLPFGDAWHYGDVEFLPKKEILKRLEQQKRMSKLYGHA